MPRPFESTLRGAAAALGLVALCVAVGPDPSAAQQKRASARASVRVSATILPALTAPAPTIAYASVDPGTAVTARGSHLVVSTGPLPAHQAWSTELVGEGAGTAEQRWTVEWRGRDSDRWTVTPVNAPMLRGAGPGEFHLRVRPASTVEDTPGGTATEPARLQVVLTYAHKST